MPRLARLLGLALVSSLLVLGVGAASPVEAKPEVHPEWGSTSIKAHVLKYSCRNYRYSYAITPPKGDWALETFLIGPGGVHLSSGAMVIGMDPLNGHDKFRFCAPSTRPGIFKIRALLSVQDETGKDHVQGWLPVTRFRLH
jgi:hypothetical protein